MSNLEEIRKYVLTLFSDNFQPAYPTVDIRFENARFPTMTDRKPFVNIREEPMIESPAALGGRITRFRGLLVVDALAPEDTGTKEIREYLSKAADILRYHTGYIPNVGHITIEYITYNQLEVFRGLYSLSLAAHYRVDVCKK